MLMRTAELLHKYVPSVETIGGSRAPSLDLLISLAVYFDVSTDYLLMGRDYVNLHSGKKLESVLQALSGIIADLQDV